MRSSLVLVSLLAAACSEHGSTPGDGGDLGKLDGGSGGFVCEDDSLFEPNDTIQTAFEIPATSTITFEGLALCPGTDVDHYKLTTTTTATLEAVVQNEPSVSPGLAILNAGGSVIANGTGGGIDTRVMAPNAPAGTYFVRVAAGGVQSNYRLTVNVTP